MKTLPQVMSAFETAAFIVGATEYPPLPNWEQPTPWKFLCFCAGVIVGMGALMWIINFIDAR